MREDGHTFLSTKTFAPSLLEIEVPTLVAVIQAEVDEGRPALLWITSPDPAFGGGSHVVVVDGYQTGPTTQVPINYGWDGAYISPVAR